MRIVILKMPKNVNPDYASNITRDAMEKIAAINRKIRLGESDELVTLALPSGWGYEVVDDVDRLDGAVEVVGGEQA